MSGLPGIAPAPELTDERRLALVIATEIYVDPSLRQLRAPAHDVQELMEVLSDPLVGGFAVTSVINKASQEIRLTIEEFLDDRSPGDLLFIYLSCHGLVDQRRRLFFAGTDTLKKRLAATGVEAQWLLDQLEECRARRQVVILDCCFSGAFANAAKGDEDLGLVERFSTAGRGRVVLTASRGSEYSFEGEPVPGSAMPGSVFTGALVEGIRSGAADLDRDGLISVDDAYGYAFDRLRAVGAHQTPQRWLYGAEGDIFLARSPAGVTITPASLPEGIRSGLESPHVEIRLGAVQAVGGWFGDGDPPHALAARQALQEVADSDVPKVAQAAQALLDAHPAHSQLSLATANGRTSSTTPSLTKVGPAGDESAVTGARTSSRSRGGHFLIAGIAAAALGLIGLIVWLLAQNPSQTPTGGGEPSTSSEFSAEAPWRLVISNNIQQNDQGCFVRLLNETSEEVWKNTSPIYGSRENIYQMHNSGTFRWTVNDSGCTVVYRSGSPLVKLPTSAPCCQGDSAAFKAPEFVTVQVKVFEGSPTCRLDLRDLDSGTLLDYGIATQDEKETVALQTSGRSQVYLGDLQCGVLISAG